MLSIAEIAETEQHWLRRRLRVTDPIIVTYPVIGTFWNMVKV